MRASRALLAAVLVAVLAGCTSDDGTSGTTGSAFRNLGKRGDANLAGQASAGAHR